MEKLKNVSLHSPARRTNMRPYQCLPILLNRVSQDIQLGIFGTYNFLPQKIVYAGIKTLQYFTYRVLKIYVRGKSEKKA